jgi:hypothetical protein
VEKYKDSRGRTKAQRMQLAYYYLTYRRQLNRVKGHLVNSIIRPEDPAQNVLFVALHDCMSYCNRMMDLLVDDRRLVYHESRIRRANKILSKQGMRKG